MYLIGAVRVGVAEADRERFYRELFTRLPAVIGTSALTRYVGFRAAAGGEHVVEFLGIEVDTIAPLPDGLLAWDLTPQSLIVMEGAGRVNRVVWHEDVAWQWRHEHPTSHGPELSGEFTVRVPPQWSGTSRPQDRVFWMSANARGVADLKSEPEHVLLAAFDPGWGSLAAACARWLKRALGPELALRIEHIGSTAIPGMPSKPVLDILVEVPSYGQARSKAIPLLSAEGWEYWWYQDHMVFIRRDPATGIRTHHLHMIESGCELLKRLAFRDYLRTHPTEASAYAALKHRLARLYRDDRERYTAAKATFVEGIVEKALTGSAIKEGLPPRGQPRRMRS